MHRPFALLTLVALSAIGWTALRKTHRKRLAGRPTAKPEALQTWEGEGGGLPDAGPGRRTPDPAPRDTPA